MGSVIRISSLVLCVAAGVGAAIWLAGRDDSSSGASPAGSDAPDWQHVSAERPSNVIKPPVVLVPAAGETPSDHHPPVVASKTTPPATPRLDTSWPLTPGPWLLPPAGQVADDVADDLLKQEETPPKEAEPPGELLPQLGEPPAPLVNAAKPAAESPSSTTAAAPTPKKHTETPATSSPSAQQQSNPASANRDPKDRNTQVTPEGDGRLSLHLVDSDIREVLQLLSRGAGVAIMPSDAVQGKISASLPNVDFQTALGAILRSKGLVWKRDGNVIYVGSQEEFKKRDLTAGKITTRLYRPNYVRAAELQKLFTNLLTPQVGTITVTSPSGVGIGADSSTAGGDDYANCDVVLVRDYESVLADIDAVFREVDTQPLQVEIEAMILSVKLADTMDLGVDFDALRGSDHVRIVSGTPAASLTGLAVGKGLKVGYLDTNLAVFVKALETIGDTNVIATPRILALNKMRAEILIGAQLGYVSTTVTETSTTQAVQFLEVGTQLRIRPFISNDGMVRMELHPELSTGVVRVEEGLTLPDKEVTGVTTNIMARDGSTVIIGGLIREDLDKQATQIPFFGSLPVVGAVFRQQVQKTDRREIIVLITPRIVCDPELKREGNLAATEFHHRQAFVGEKMSPFSKVHLCKKYIYLSQQAWAADNQARALRLINLALHFDPQNRSALDLRADIVGGVHFGNHTGQGPFLPSPEAQTPCLDGAEIPPWVLDDLDPAAPPQVRPLPPPQGTVGEKIDIGPAESP